MPYSSAQCRLFAAKAARGEKVPDDWRNECRKHQKGKHRRKPKQSRRYSGR